VYQPKLDGVNLGMLSDGDGRVFVFTRGGNIKHKWHNTRGVFGGELMMPPHHMIVCEL
jgi:hypothetical protein